MAWWDDGLVLWWIRYPKINTVVARCLGGMVAWFVGGYVALQTILFLQDDLVGSLVGLLVASLPYD
jgi:hypothetical protein